MSMNESIIINFEKLIKQLENEHIIANNKEKIHIGFKIKSLDKALSIIKNHKSIIKSGDEFIKVSGFGKGTINRISEILTTGRLSELVYSEDYNYNSKYSEYIKELTSVIGIGEIHAKKYILNGITSIDQLYNKWISKEIVLNNQISIGLKYYKDFQLKIPYDEVYRIKLAIKKVILLEYPSFIVKVCGSHRRKCEYSGDIDVTISSPYIIKVIDTIYLSNIVNILIKNKIIIDNLTSFGSTKYMGVCVDSIEKIARRIDIRFVPYESYYTTILYFTGSVELNKEMRRVAIKKEYLLNEYGLFDKNKERISIKSEKHIFELLEMEYLSPKNRNL